MAGRISIDNYSASREIYQSLSKGCIRLLVLRHGTTTPPECSLEIIELSKAIEKNFEALSYVWGKGSYESITIHDHDFPVTQNLYDALLVLRQEDSERRLWVDAVCINQSDDHEKEDQIQMMADIYKGAREVVVWLGNADCTTAPALKLLAAARLQNDSKVAALFNAASSGAYTALAAIMDREYWYRAWIVQEIAFARQLRIYCGREWFSFESLEWALDNLPQVLSITGLAGATQAFALSPPTFRSRLLRSKNLNKGKMDPQFYLQSLIDRRCTKPQDFVFAYFCLFPEEIQRCINVDYKSNPGTVLLQAISAIIECTESLTVLGIRSRQLVPNDPEHTWQHTMPSWCPYVGTSFKECAMASSRVLPELDTVTGKPKFDAVTLHLHTFGLTIGTITKMVTNRVRRKREINEASLNESTIWYMLRHCLDWIELGISLPDCRGDCNGRQLAGATAGSSILGPELLQLVNDFWNHTRNQRICRVRRATCDDDDHEEPTLDTIARVPETACKKDKICWIKGCLSAIVLREVRQAGSQGIAFKVVGEAYVEGLDELRSHQSIETFILE